MPTRSRRNFFKQLAVGGAALSATTAFATPGAEKPGEKIKVDRRKLGRLGAEVSILGLGLGSVFTGPYENDVEAAHGLLAKALEYGINYWDTARVYGPSETMIGPMVAKHRDKIFLVSKSGDRSYDGFKRDLETSLKNLQTDRIDLYHLHSIEPRKDKDLSIAENGAVKAAREAREQGIIGGYGISGHSGAKILAAAIKALDPDAILTTFPVDRPDDGTYEDLILPLAKERNMGVIAMKTVRWVRNSDLPVREMIRYSMSLSGVTTAIVGLDTHAHLEDNAKLATNFQAMDKQQMAQLSQLVSQRLASLGEAPWKRPGYDDVAEKWHV